MSTVLNGLLALMLLAAGCFTTLSAGENRIVAERLIRGTPAAGISTASQALSTPRLMITRAGVAGPDMEATSPQAVRPAHPTGERMAQAGSATPVSTTTNAAPGQRATTASPASTKAFGAHRSAGDNDTARRLASQIQTELQRVGCYKGTIDGEWGQDSRRAMKVFNDRVNATLPVDHPDYILLTLLQGHAAAACGAACPLGEIDAGGGICKPLSVLAEARRQARDDVPAEWARRMATAAAATSSVVAAGKPTATPPAGPLASPTAEEARQMDERQAALERARNELDTLARDKAARDKISADIEAARRLAVDEAHRKAVAERATADAERTRLAAAEQLRQQTAADARARADAERLARLAAAETSRNAAEVRRQQELAALAERTRQETERAQQLEAAKQAANAASAAARQQAAAAPPNPATPLPADGNMNAKPHPPTQVAAAVINKDAQAARFVGRFVPPPTYHVGLLPKAPTRSREQQVRERPPARERVAPRGTIARVAARPSASGTRGIFRDIQRNAP